MKGGTEILRFAVFQQQRVERFKNLGRADLERDGHAQPLARVFVKNGQHLVRATVAQLVVDDVHTPYMVRVRRPQSDDGTVFVIEPLALSVPVRQLQTLLLPEALHLLVVHRPTFDTQQLRHLAIAIAPVLLRQSDQC